jgi:uncharacterized protein YjbJ (UPF0337 family)
MDERRVTGEGKRGFGAAQRGAGDLLGNGSLQAKGAMSEAEGTAENLLGQAKDAVRQVADSASEYAQDAYDRGSRYVRQEWDRHPEANRYFREGREMISSPVEANPIAAILIAGAVGYLLAYLIHGSGWQWNRESVPDYARTRNYSRR